MRTYVRDEIGIVRDNVLKQSAVVEILVSAVRETQLEMRGLKALMKTMTEKIDGLTEDNRALRVQILVPDIAAAASSIDTTSGRNGNGRVVAIRGAPRWL